MNEFRKGQLWCEKSGVARSARFFLILSDPSAKFPGSSVFSVKYCCDIVGLRSNPVFYVSQMDVGSPLAECLCRVETHADVMDLVLSGVAASSETIQKMREFGWW